jgi:hypothetical protein
MKTKACEKAVQAGPTAAQLTEVYSKRSEPLVIGGPVRCKDCIALVFVEVERKVGYFLRMILEPAYRYVRP